MPDYQAIREACCEANKSLPASKLVDLTFGNVSVCDADRRVMAIKPSGVDYDALSPADMVIVDLATGETLEGDLRPSSDTPTHRRLYQLFQTAGAIVHTHSRHAVAWAQAGRDLPCFGTTHADYFHGAVPCTRPMTSDEIAADYEWNTAEVIGESFAERDPADCPAVLMHGHGPFVWGPTAPKAVETAMALEIVAQMALQALQIHPSMPPLQKPQRDKHFFRKHGKTAYYGQG
ncbi:MAG: L-ribulose-5-phosphate 4-epimerase AraD [Opitutales bacterium]